MHEGIVGCHINLYGDQPGGIKIEGNAISRSQGGTATDGTDQSAVLHLITQQGHKAPNQPPLVDH